MEIERRIYNNNDTNWFYGVYTLINLNGYIWRYIEGSLLWEWDIIKERLPIYTDEPDGYYVNFRESHLDGDS